ncbi:MAG: hypothetical protein M1823_005371 [Watsoniomyces obsoletus]|nr:MAG: hypothetical protein M1823_005371 [Watsoniomyces obsoletus]
MVLLTITPAMVNAIRAYQSLPKSSSAQTISHPPEEPSLDDPVEGQPISHGQLFDIITVLESSENEKHDDRYTLDYLLRGSKVYVPPPPPKPEPTDEYKALMARLRFQEEERAYERMSQPASATEGVMDAKATSNAIEEEDEVTYADVNRQLALIVNILVSIVACSCAVWMACSHWSAPTRLGLSMASSGLVGVAEVVVYAGYLRRVQSAKVEGRKRVETKQITKTWVIKGDKVE